MDQLDIFNHPHKRFNPLTGDWVLVSPHRLSRPWNGQSESESSEELLKYDPACYLCPGNKRANGEFNPTYAETFIFDNDFGALKTDCPKEPIIEEELFKARYENGICRVICFSPYHNITIPEMSLDHIEKVIDLWQEQYIDLGSKKNISYVQIFENKGLVMGCSNPHPHGQIWAQNSIPHYPALESKFQHNYYNNHGNSLLKDYLDAELSKKERIIIVNEHFAVLVPFWAVWPFETIVISREPRQNLSQLSEDEKSAFALVIKELTILYDNLFEIPFPYSAGLHQSPTDGKDHPYWHLHMHFYPPLLRSSIVKKFMVGYEMLANPQRDLTAEKISGMLRSLSKKHYKSV